MTDFSKTLIFFGAVLILIGVLAPLIGKLGLGRLPGDLYFRKGTFTFYVPFMTCLLLSVLLTLFFTLFRR